MYAVVKEYKVKADCFSLNRIFKTQTTISIPVGLGAAQIFLFELLPKKKKKKGWGGKKKKGAGGNNCTEIYFVGSL